MSDLICSLVISGSCLAFDGVVLAKRLIRIHRLTHRHIISRLGIDLNSDYNILTNINLTLNQYESDCPDLWLVFVYQ